MLCGSARIGGNGDVQDLCRAVLRWSGSGRWANGVVASHLPSMRGAPGAIPIHFWVSLLAHVAGHMHGPRTIQLCLALVEHRGVR
jgi:hypothetical protein